MRWTRAALLAPALAGCSLIYNPNNLPNPPVEAGIDAPIDAPPIDAPFDAPPDVPPGTVLDANEAMLTISDITPSAIDEGQGDAGSLPGVFVIRGHNIVNANLKVELIPPDGVTVLVDPVTDALASHNGDYLAFTVIAHVDTALAGDVALGAKVSQDISPQYGGGTATQLLPVPLTLHGLPELTSTSPGVNKTTKVITLPLPQAKYSRVDLSDVTPAKLTTTSSAIGAITAVSSIVMGAITADATTTTPGPGGFATAGPGAGHAGMTAGALGNGGGGGGAGLASPGTDGATAAGTAGTGGAMTGEPQILSLASNLPSAGGAGGGGFLLATPGGAPGAGAGMVVLVAGGDITTGTISAVGGNAGTAGSSGGGGAGGTIVIRTTNGALSIDTIRVRGGNGSSATVGNGSVGRVRWDAPAGANPASPDSAPHRGPVFVAPARIVAAPQPYALSGTNGDELDVRVTDQANTPHTGEHISFNSEGIATTTPSLFAGYNLVCVKLMGGTLTEPVANACVDVVFLP
jgi:hypothetical protein